MPRLTIGVFAVMLAGLLAAAPAQPAPDVPVTGMAGAGLDRFDALMKKILVRFEVPGGALAVTRHGRLVLARGYGYSDVQTGKPVEPTSLFRLASVSKSVTAVAVLKLVEEGKLDLDARVFELLRPMRPPPGAEVDPRLHEITVRQLLYHAGGWSREKSGDPIGFGQRAARALGVEPPVTPFQLARYMKGQPLDFTPGTRCDYSNYGYMLLGLVVERAAGEPFHEGVRPYEEYVRQKVLRPMGVRRMRLAPHLGERAPPAEVQGYGPENERTAQTLPVVHFASGGWVGDAVDLARFLTALDGSHGKPYLSADTVKLMLSPPPPPVPPRSNGSHFGMGWDVVQSFPDGVLYHKGGGLPGTATYIEHRPNGTNWVVLFNASRKKPVDPEWHHEFIGEIRKAADETKGWPGVDFFPQFP
jgi:N-acyl-D-amino-acid deacylase